MESIKYKVKDHSVEFSKRALTIDNKVYSYTGISQIKHSSAYHAYLFKYNGEWVKLFYNEPDGKTIAILFKRIQKMNERRAAYARATQSIDTSAIAAALAASSGEKPKVEPAAPEAKAEEPAAEPAEEAPKAEEAPVVEEPPAVEEAPEVEEAPADEAEEKPAEETPTEEAPAAEEAPAEEPAKDAETIAAEAAEAEIKKAKRKKAFLIFGIIIALFLIAGIIYFLTVGTTDDSSQGPNVDETHQYNDIDELIEEMQE
ncbi:MAG: hypothetical protein IJH22_04310 [Firmicutes bacterium]|nr:hypothetical protein [Bacillota bacterium]